MNTRSAITQTQDPVRSSNRFRLQLSLLLSVCACATGCQTISGIPVSRVPREILATELKDDFQDISMLRLRQDEPEYYALGPGDVLGLLIVKPNTDEEDAPPIVHFPEDGTLPPAVGVPTPIREDGTISVPLIPPVNVEGLSLTEAEAKLQQAYLGGAAPKLLPGTQIGLNMIRKRVVRVLVIREESGGVADVSKRGTGHTIELPAYENDLLNALSRTGGFPGVDAENEILIYRGLFVDGYQSDQAATSRLVQTCLECEDPCFCDESPQPDPPTVTRVPLRYHPTRPPTFTQEDIILQNGDIVIIRSRDTETFYTAGLLGGGEHLLPRDKDLDVLGAIAIAGGPIGQIGTGIGAVGGGGRGGGMGGGGGRGGGYCQPTEVLIMRELPCGDQIVIEVDLDEALQDPSQRVIIKPNDVILLRYKVSEEISNVLLSLIQFNFLFSGFSGNGF